MAAPMWPYILGVLVVAAAVRAYDSWQVSRARAARIAERKAKEIQKIKARFSAALIDDAGSQQWIPASAPRSVEDLSRTCTTHPPSLMSDATSAFRTLKAKKPKKLPLSTPFPAAMVWGQSGCVASISFRDTSTPTSDWGFSMQDSIKLSAALASSSTMEASQAQPAGSDDAERETWLWDVNDEDDEEDEIAYKEWRNFARHSKLDRVLDTWDHSQLQTERPVPKCLERNF